MDKILQRGKFLIGFMELPVTESHRRRRASSKRTKDMKRTQGVRSSSIKQKATCIKDRAVSRFHLPKVSKRDEIGYFAPREWGFWRSLITCFCLICIIGHWMEIPYCLFMDQFFGIVAEDYAVWSDPWYHPYWVYGIGAVIMTLVLEPLKEVIVLRRKTLWGALLETFVITVILSMLMELVIGWIVNQPDASGQYPYWDNSQMPLNIFGQAWLVNDIAIGLMAVLYVWVIYPLVCEGYSFLRPSIANKAFGLVVIGFAVGCTLSYTQLALGF